MLAAVFENTEEFAEMAQDVHRTAAGRKIVVHMAVVEGMASAAVDAIAADRTAADRTVVDRRTADRAGWLDERERCRSLWNHMIVVQE